MKYFKLVFAVALFIGTATAFFQIDSSLIGFLVLLAGFTPAVTLSIWFYNDVKADQEKSKIETIMTEKPIEKSSSKPIEIKGVLYFGSFIFFVTSIILAVTGFNRFDTYKPEYVGGDAYNYIINATYFAGFMAVCAGCLISSVILFVAGIFKSRPVVNKHTL